MRFSLRTAFLATTVIAVLCAVYASAPFWLVPAFIFVAWAGVLCVAWRYHRRDVVVVACLGPAVSIAVLLLEIGRVLFGKRTAYALSDACMQLVAIAFISMIASVITLGGWALFKVLREGDRTKSEKVSGCVGDKPEEGSE